MAYLERICTIFVITLLLANCVTTEMPSTKTAWEGIISKCAVASETIGKNTIYFGPTNGVGPGSVWRETNTNGFNLRRQFIEEELRRQFDNNEYDDEVFKSAVVKGEMASCNGDLTSSWDFNPSLVFSSQLLPIDAELSATLNRGDIVDVKINGWALDYLSEGPYEDLIFSMLPNAPFRRDLNTENRVVVIKAVRIKDLELTLKFNSKNAAEAKATINETIGRGNKISPKVALNWKADGNLALVTSGEFYIFGEFGYFKSDGFGLGGSESRIVEFDVMPNTKIGLDDDEINSSVKY